MSTETPESLQNKALRIYTQADMDDALQKRNEELQERIKSELHYDCGDCEYCDGINDALRYLKQP